MTTQSEDVTLKSNQFFTFHLHNEIFAMEIDAIREVLELPQITRIPRAPEYMRGVINLRGHAVPVVDLRAKFGMPEKEATVDTCIIIFEVLMEGDPTILGALVDAVSEVVEMPEGAIEAPPKMGAGVKTEYIKGIGNVDNTFVILLDNDRIFSMEELTGSPPATALTAA